MKNNLIFYFLIFLIFPFLNCRACNNYSTITVSQSILQQALYYQVDNTSINNTFVDFNYFKFYKLDMEKIIPQIKTFYLNGFLQKKNY
jgi:hypothetical protein